MLSTNNFKNQDKNGMNLTIFIFEEGVYAVAKNPTSESVEAYEEAKQINNLELTNHSFAEVNVLLCNSDFTLIPNAIYDENHLEEYLNFSVETNSAGQAKVTNNNRFGLKVIWHLKDSIKDSIIKIWPGANFKHLMCIELDKINEELSNNSIFVHQFNEGCSLVLFEENQLKLANYFSCKEENDALYFVLLTLSQTNTDTNHLTVFLNGTKGFMKKLNNYFPQVNQHLSTPKTELNLNEKAGIYSILA